MLVIGFPIIDPVAVEIGPLAIRWYSLAYVAGILFGWRYALRLADLKHNSLKRTHIDDFIVWATLGIILGGRLGYVLFYRPDFFIDKPIEIFAMWKGGMSFHGGLLGIIVSGWLFTLKRQISIYYLSDVVCAVAPIGLFFGRIANFINGELYGRQTDVYWAMVFPRGGELPRHPSQLYEAGLEGFLLFFCISVVVFRFQGLERPGLVSGVFMTGYGVFRYLVEFYREPDSHLGTIYGIATMGQLLSVPLILIGISLIYLAWHRT